MQKSEGLVRVGRWMHREEYALMVHTAYVQESTSGTTHVAFPADRAAFQAQAPQGSYYVEFDVPRSSVKPTQQGWAKVLGPNTLEGRQARKARTLVPQMPTALNIQHIATKQADTMQTNQLQKMEFEVVQAPDGSSMYIDISLPSVAARATIGRLGTGQGYCDTEVVETEADAPTQWRHQEFSSSTEINLILTEFFQKLRDLPAADQPDSSFDLPLSDKTIRLNALLEPLLAVASG